MLKNINIYKSTEKKITTGIQNNKKNNRIVHASEKTALFFRSVRKTISITC
jgi:hypothetical protein